MSAAPPGLGSRVAAGAAFGARSAMVYFAFESIVVGVLPALRGAESATAAPTPAYLALLLAGYAALGAAAGAALGVCLACAAQRRPSLAHAATSAGVAALATLAVVVAFALAVALQKAPSPALGAVLGCAIGLAVALVAAARAPRDAAWLRAVANPWTATALPLGLAYLLFDALARAAPAARAGWAFAFAAGLVLAAFCLVTLGRRRRGDASRAGARSGALGALSRAGLAAAAALAAVAAVGADATPARPEARGAGPAAGRPDVVIVTLDTVRSDHLSLYGYERDTTPELERIARGATLYTRAVASSDLTLSTHASLFTGLYARHHGAHLGRTTGAGRLSARVDTLAEILRREGYQTAAVVGNPTYLSARYGLARGFEHYDDRRPEPFHPELPAYLLGRALRTALASIAPLDDAFRSAPYGYRRAAEINREVGALLDRTRAPGRPLFLFVNYMDPHWPYAPPAPFDRRFPGRLAAHEDAPGMSELAAARRLERALSEAERRHLVSQYDGEIAYTDGELGRLVERLSASGIYERALFVVTADHGEAIGEHGLVGHGVSVYQNQVYVPLLIKFPNQREPVRVDERVSSVDVLPTVLDVLGLPIPDRVEGRSLAPGAPPRDRIVLAESYPGALLHRAHPRFRRVARAVFAGDLKLIATTAGGRELYDLSRDPAERNDLYDAAAPPHALERALEAWLAGRAAAPRGSAGRPDAEMRARLRALGYLD